MTSDDQTRSATNRHELEYEIVRLRSALAKAALAPYGISQDKLYATSNVRAAADLAYLDARAAVEGLK